MDGESDTRLVAMSRLLVRLLFNRTLSEVDEADSYPNSFVSKAIETYERTGVVLFDMNCFYWR
jgi:hypothetical protein